MKWREHTIEIITPCINAGANQSEAEIRVPSIRGQVRWWFRALGGTCVEEKLLFGSVHGEAKGSKVAFRLRDPLTSNVARNLEDLVGRDMNHPQAYLLWPLRPTRNSQQKRGMIDPGKTFVLRYSADRLQDETLARKLESAIEAWILLGALGTRSRRGFGSLGFHDAPPIASASTNGLKQRVADALAVFGRPKIKVMLLSGPMSDADAALDSLGKWLKQHRAGSTRSVPNPGRWGKNDHNVGMGVGNKVYRPVIGLPLTQRYQDGRRVETELSVAARWASPVHLKIGRCGNAFYPMAVFFPEMAIPDGSHVTLRGDRGSRDVPVDHGLLKEMMKTTPDSVVLWEG